MSRFILTCGLSAACLLAAASTASAQQSNPTIPPQVSQHHQQRLQQRTQQRFPHAAPQPVRQQQVQQTGYALGTTMGMPAASGGLPSVPAQGYGPVIPGNRPVTQAPLYPAPIQSTPWWNGGAVITNQALAPHEMLYPHQYRAMYGPYFYEVKGHTFWTPIGMRTFENWKLRGTEVEVKYHDHIKLFSGFHPPRGDYQPGYINSNAR